MHKFITDFITASSETILANQNADKALVKAIQANPEKALELAQAHEQESARLIRNLQPVGIKLTAYMLIKAALLH